MKLKRILKEINELPSEFVVSHSFTDSNGNKVTQYKLTNGYGGYARVVQHKDGYEMTNIIIDDELRGKGIATKFYKEINDESKSKTGKTLQSIKPDKQGNIELSSDGKRFWESLVKNGFAKKIKTNRYRFK